MTRLTGTIRRTIPNPDYVDDDTTPDIEPTIDETVDARLWLVEVDTDTPNVFCILVNDGDLTDNDIPSGVYRLGWTYAEGGKPVDPPKLAVEDGVTGEHVDTYPDAVYSEDGTIVDLGDPVAVFQPIRDSGGMGPVVVIPEDAPDTMELTTVPYRPPAMEEENQDG